MRLFREAAMAGKIIKMVKKKLLIIKKGMNGKNMHTGCKHNSGFKGDVRSNRTSSR